MWIEKKGDVWSPEVEGEYVEGVIINEDNGDYGRQLVLETADQRKIKTPAHKVLQDRTEAMVIGDRIRIEFKGMKPSKGGKNDLYIYKIYEWKE